MRKRARWVLLAVALGGGGYWAGYTLVAMSRSAGYPIRGPVTMHVGTGMVFPVGGEAVTVERALSPTVDSSLILIVRDGCQSCGAEVESVLDALDTAGQKSSYGFLVIFVVDTVRNWSSQRLEDEFGRVWRRVADRVVLADPAMARDWRVSEFPVLLGVVPARSRSPRTLAMGTGIASAINGSLNGAEGVVPVVP